MNSDNSLSMEGQEAPAARAYTQAGHVLMAYLIVEAGIADHVFAMPIAPSDRAFLVPEFDQLTLDSDLAQLDRPLPSLRSFTTMPLFLLGGSAADRIREHIPEDVPLPSTRAVSRAWGMLAGYLEEFFGPEVSHDHDRLNLMLRDYYAFVEREVARHWRAVERLASRIGARGGVSRLDAFRLLESLIPEAERAPARRLGARSGQKGTV